MERRSKNLAAHLSRSACSQFVVVCFERAVRCAFAYCDPRANCAFYHFKSCGQRATSAIFELVDGWRGGYLPVPSAPGGNALRSYLQYFWSPPSLYCDRWFAGDVKHAAAGERWQYSDLCGRVGAV